MTNLTDRLFELKKQRNAVILVHNYQKAEVQDVADFVGDSLGLSQQAADTSADVILFCGVHFMAETAAIICPEKTVLLPDENAGCPMANMVTARELRRAKQEHPDAVVVCYVNSSATVKAECDICCTSANAVKIVDSIPRDREIIFVPDKSLGSFVSKQLNRPMILWPGYCPTHHRILADEIKHLKEQHPSAEIVVHPECTEDVIALADKTASTTGILDYCRTASATEFIIGTEIGIKHRLEKENPGKTFHTCVLADCPNMKLTTLEKMIWALEDMAPVVSVDPQLAEAAGRCIRKMLEAGRKE